MTYILKVCRFCYELIVTAVLITQLVQVHRAASIAVTSTRSNCRQPTSGDLWTRLRHNANILSMPPVPPVSDPTVQSNLDGENSYIDESTATETRNRHVTSHPVRHARKRHNRRLRNRSRNVTNIFDDSGNEQAKLIANRRRVSSSSRRSRLNRNRMTNRGNITARRYPRHAVHDVTDDVKLSGRTSWQCVIDKYWKRMPSDVYPPYIQTGKCKTTTTCMLGMYECRPVKYAINILRKVSTGADQCVPLPTTNTTSTTYEQAWILSHFQVTVACQCSNKRTVRAREHSPAPFP